MPKSSTDDLFTLVKSMNKAEKGFFRKNTESRNRHNPPVYLKLYQALDKQKQYDEKKILKKLPAIKPARISDVKNFLYNLLLTKLEHFHTSTDSVLSSKLNHVEILFERGLYKQSRKLLSKAWQIAGRGEKHLICLLILRWQKRIDAAEFNTANMKNAAHTFETEKLLLGQYLNLCEYQQMDSELSLLTRGAKSTLHKSKSKEFEKAFKTRFLRDENHALSVNARIEYHRILSLYHFALGNPAEYESECGKVVEQLESRPELLNDMQGLYARSVYNLLLANSNRGHISKVQENIRKIRALKPRTNEVKLRQFTAINFELSMLFTNGEFEKMNDLVGEIEAGFKRLGDKVNHDDAAYFNYQLARIFLITKQHNKALFYLGRILNASKEETRFPEDIYCFAHLLRILVHVEMDNMNIIGHLVKSAHRFLQKRRNLYELESCILNFFQRKVTSVSTFKKLISQLPELKSELQKILQSSQEQNVVNYFDFISWIESKTENRPMLEIMRAKLRHL